MTNGHFRTGKAWVFACVACGLGALMTAGANAQDAGAAANAGVRGYIAPEAVRAVNDYLAAVNAGDVPRSAQCAYFKSKEERALFEDNFQKLLAQQPKDAPWEGVRLRSLEPLSEGGFLIRYELRVQRMAGVFSLERNDEVHTVDGVWKVFPARVFATANTDVPETPPPSSPLAEKVSRTAGAAPCVLDAALARSQPMTRGADDAVADAAPSPLLQAAQAAIQSVQDTLAQREPSPVFLFGFKVFGDRLELLCALPLSGETGADFPLYVFDDDTTLAYQLTDKGKRDPDMFSFALAYAWRTPSQPGLLETRLINPRAVLLPQDTLYPVETTPGLRNPKDSKGYAYAFVLAHLPLTDGCFVVPRNAAAPDKTAQTVAAPALDSP